MVFTCSIVFMLPFLISVAMHGFLLNSKIKVRHWETTFQHLRHGLHNPSAWRGHTWYQPLISTCSAPISKESRQIMQITPEWFHRTVCSRSNNVIESGKRHFDRASLISQISMTFHILWKSNRFKRLLMFKFVGLWSLLWGRQTSTLWMARETLWNTNLFQVQLHTAPLYANLQMDANDISVWGVVSLLCPSGAMASILISGSRYTKSLPGSPKNISNACHLLAATCHQPPQLGFLTGISPDPMA